MIMHGVHIWYCVFFFGVLSSVVKGSPYVLDIVINKHVCLKTGAIRFAYVDKPRNP